jgi:hypothetical protein
MAPYWEQLMAGQRFDGKLFTVQTTENMHQNLFPAWDHRRAARRRIRPVMACKSAPKKSTGPDAVLHGCRDNAFGIQPLPGQAKQIKMHLPDSLFG